MDSIKAYWRQWLWRDMTTRIITVNVIAWIIIAIGLLVGNSYRANVLWISWFAVPAHIQALPARLWTVVTYMVSQADFLHLLVNMLWLLLFGQLINHAMGDKRLLQLYVLSGLAGAVAFIVSNAIVPGSYPYMIGSSCAVLGVIGAAAIYAANWRVNLLLLGEVKIKWVALATIVLFVIMESNIYICIAHIAGLAVGLAYGWKQAHGWNFPTYKFKRQSPYKPSGSTASDEAQLDALLAKVSRSGYSSLSPSERQRLFELSQKIKR